MDRVKPDRVWIVSITVFLYAFYTLKTAWLAFDRMAYFPEIYYIGELFVVACAPCILLFAVRYDHSKRWGKAVLLLATFFSFFLTGFLLLFIFAVLRLRIIIRIIRRSRKNILILDLLAVLFLVLPISISAMICSTTWQAALPSRAGVWPVMTGHRTPTRQNILRLPTVLMYGLGLVRGRRTEL